MLVVIFLSEKEKAIAEQIEVGVKTGDIFGRRQAPPFPRKEKKCIPFSFSFFSGKRGDNNRPFLRTLLSLQKSMQKNRKKGNLSNLPLEEEVEENVPNGNWKERGRGE